MLYRGDLDFEPSRLTWRSPAEGQPRYREDPSALPLSERESREERGKYLVSLRQSIVGASREREV